MTTFQGLIHRTRNYLMTGFPDRLNVLAVSVDNLPTTTTIQFTHTLNGINTGTTLCIGLEEMYVLSVTGQTAGSSATVIRAMNGSTISAHTSNDVIEVNPHYSSFRISQAVNSGLEDISAEGLFRIKSVEFPYNPVVQGYNINATDLLDVWRVRYNDVGPSQDWPVLRPDQYRIDQDANTTDFAQGNQIVLYVPGFPGHNIRVSYKAPYTTLTTLSDDVLTISGLHAEAHDIPALSAAVDLSVGREIKRTFLNRQPERRRQEEVPPGAIQRSVLGIMQHYDKRIVTETRRLHRRYPTAI